jgi:hypothetical protein
MAGFTEALTEDPIKQHGWMTQSKPFPVSPGCRRS